MASRATAVLPVKRFGAAKGRLGVGFDGQGRRELIAAMLRDVLDRLGASRMVDHTIVVSGEPLAQEIASEAGAEAVPDPEDVGHIEAALIGVDAALAHGAQCVVLVPGDCPLLEPRELDSLLTGVPDPYVAVVPDRHGTGTNALLLSPPDAIRPSFGEGSCERHLDAARAAGLPHGVENVGSLALDLDTPADLIALTRELEAGRGKAPNTARVLGL